MNDDQKKQLKEIFSKHFMNLVTELAGIEVFKREDYVNDNYRRCPTCDQKVFYQESLEAYFCLTCKANVVTDKEKL